MSHPILETSLQAHSVKNPESGKARAEDLRFLHMMLSSQKEQVEESANPASYAHDSQTLNGYSPWTSSQQEDLSCRPMILMK